jgi:carbon-monoxide dehydrogenase large subunit
VVVVREADANSSLGARLPRFEDGRLLRGRGTFTADLPPARCLHAVFVRSPHPHALIEAVDVTRAGSAPGVGRVLTAADLPHVPLVDAVAVPGLVKTPQPALAGERVRFVGEAVAMVLAESRALAEDAAELVEVRYAALPPVVDPGAAPTRPPLDPALSGNEVYSGERATPGLEEAFAAADHVVSGTFTSGRLTAAPMEGRACSATYDPVVGTLTVRCSTQSPHLLQRKIATCLGLDLAAVRVLVDDVGGGFGQKIPASPEEIAVALAARAAGRPVLWVEDRRENVVAAPQGKEQRVELALALDADGTFRALRCDVLGDAGAYSFNSASALIEAYLAAGLLPGAYRIPETGWRVRSVLTTKAPIAPYRGVGWTAGHTARELLIDRAARLLGRDPVDLRRQNLIRPHDLPYTTPTGMTYDSGSHLTTLERAAKLVDAANVVPGPTADGHCRGIGISPYVEPSGWGSAGAAESSWSFASHDSVRVEMTASGAVTAVIGTPSQGQGHTTTLAQLVASVLTCDPRRVRVVTGDTAGTPLSTAGTRASRVATVIGGALLQATERLAAKLALVAGHLLGADPADVSFRDGRAVAPTGSVGLAEIATAAVADPAVRAALPEPDLTATAFYDPPATYSNGCVAVVVDVDPGTGRVDVLDAAVVEDCGTVINPMIVDGQTLGAFAQGVGAALYEDAGYAADGSPHATSFADYLLPTARCLPRVALEHLESPAPHTRGGIKGMGESAMIATPGAVACAVAAAVAPLGITVDHTPIRPHELVAPEE